MKFITNVETRKLFSDSSAKSVQFLRWNVVQLLMKPVGKSEGEFALLSGSVIHV